MHIGELAKELGVEVDTTLEAGSQRPSPAPDMDTALSAEDVQSLREAFSP